MKKSPRGVTLIELIIVIVIIGILVTLGISQLFGPREQALSREALVNLKLIAAAEKIYRLEQTFYVPAANTGLTNQRLRLSLPVTNPNWNYKVSQADSTSFTGKAQRVLKPNVVLCVNQTAEDPYYCNGTW